MLHAANKLCHSVSRLDLELNAVRHAVQMLTTALTNGTGPAIKAAERLAELRRLEAMLLKALGRSDEADATSLASMDEILGASLQQINGIDGMVSTSGTRQHPARSDGDIPTTRGGPVSHHASMKMFPVPRATAPEFASADLISVPRLANAIAAADMADRKPTEEKNQPSRFSAERNGRASAESAPRSSAGSAARNSTEEGANRNSADFGFALSSTKASPMSPLARTRMKEVTSFILPNPAAVHPIKE